MAASSLREDLRGYLSDRAYRRQVHAWLRTFPWEALYLQWGVPLFALVLLVGVIVLAVSDG